MSHVVGIRVPYGWEAGFRWCFDKIVIYLNSKNEKNTDLGGSKWLGHVSQVVGKLDLGADLLCDMFPVLNHF